MKATTIVAVVAGFVSSANAAFSVTAARSGSPIHLQPINANGLQLWIGKETSSYCPSSVVEHCPKGKQTVFSGGQVSLSMNVEVPGGQLVYIDRKTGAVGYTQAHSAAMPKGAITKGWSIEYPSGSSYGYLSHRGGLLACPSPANATEGPWLIHAALKNIKFSDECLGFDALTFNSTSKYGAWEYN